MNEVVTAACIVRYSEHYLTLEVLEEFAEILSGTVFVSYHVVKAILGPSDCTWMAVPVAE